MTTPICNGALAHPTCSNPHCDKRPLTLLSKGQSCHTHVGIMRCQTDGYYCQTCGAMQRCTPSTAPIASFAPDIAKHLDYLTQLRKALTLAGHTDAAELIRGDGLKAVAVLADAQVVSPAIKESLTTQ